MITLKPLTHAPLPRWRDLLSAIFSTATDDELASPWIRPEESARWFSRSAWSLAVLAYWRQQIKEKIYVSVWLPDFFCNATLAPLREMGAKLVFYPVTEQMTPDLAACHRLAEKQPIDLFVLVHYFGQPTPAEQIVSFCVQHRAWLIEDAAHVLQPIAGVGESGDCVLYSPHKHLPIPDGAVMVIRPNGPAQLTANDDSLKIFSEVRSDVLSLRCKSNQPALRWLIKRLFQILGFRARSKLIDFKLEEESCKTDIDHPSMSTLAKYLLAPICSQMKTVAERRVQNAQTWNDVLRLVVDRCIVIQHPITTVPYLAGYSAENAASTEVLFNLLQQAGLPVTTWPDLPPEVFNQAEAHPAAVTHRFNKLYLPVHQSISEHQILRYGKILAVRASAHWQVKALSREEWEEYWRTCSQTNLLQSWQYGEGKQEAEGWTANRLLVSDNNNIPIAIVQVLTKGLPVLGHVVRINRGPLILKKLPEAEKIAKILMTIGVLLSYAKSAQWRIVQIAPELPESSHVITVLYMFGLRRVAGDAWASGRLALGRDEKSLLMHINGKWRNCMRKGLKLGVTVRQQECNEGQLVLLIDNYIALQDRKSFEGISGRLIGALAKQKNPQWQFNLFVAHEITTTKSEDTLGVLVTIRSGDTALYLIGSTTDKGRQMQANSVLLWQSILHAKKCGCSWFDIGGLSEATPRGIADFKKGLNATPYKLVGEWRKLI